MRYLGGKILRDFTVDSLEKGGESGEEAGTVAVFEKEGLWNLLEDPLWNSGSDHESAGKIRKKNLISCIYCSKKIDRI